ncbi:NifB/NifX family molybdenum-iron cluster-binding protein [Thermoplasmatota archaeon]
MNNNNLKICISSSGEDLNANVDPRFGRCDYFLIIDPKTMDFESIDNKSSKVMGGAGIQAAEHIAKTGANVVITGNVGPNAFKTLKAAGIKIITGASGNIKDILDKFNRGELNEIDSPSVGSHFGMNYKGGENR